MALLAWSWLERLSGEGANPASTPAENAGAEQRTEQRRDGVLEAAAHHANAGEDEAAETDDRAGVESECLERSHQGLRTGEAHRALGMGCGGDRKSDEQRCGRAACRGHALF